MNLIILALAVSSISYTITRSVLFAPIRKKLNWRVLKCCYCLSHWIAAFLIILDNYPIEFLDFIIITFAVITLSIPGMYIIELFHQLLERENDLPKIYGPTRKALL